MRRRHEVPSELQGRPFTTADGRAEGLSTKRMLAADLERPFHGVRVEAGGAATLLDRCRAYAGLMRPGDFFSHSTAAALWGCPLPGRFDRADAALHVSTLAPDRAHAGRGVVGHRVDPDAVGLSERHGLPVSDAATTWCDLASILVRSERSRRLPDGRGGGERRGVGLVGLDDLVAAGDHLLLTPRHPSPETSERPHLTVAELTTRVNSGFRRRGVAAARVALGLVRDGAESRPESLVRLAIVRGGLPEPMLNEPVLDARGRFIGRADMQYPRFSVVVEYDGEQHRLDDAQYARDERRLEDFQLAGHLVVRIRKSGLEALHREVARVERALVSRGWRRTTR